MKRKFIFLLWILGVVCTVLPVKATESGRQSMVESFRADSIQFSLLTCAPGNEIYELFGHTAIRYQNFSRGVDLVFNYGMFSFNTPNFVYRFIKGETDYQLGIMPYPYFESEYALRGSSVYQQVLNLRQPEKLKLLELLEENYLPENRIYRYNYFYDNCTTRARDQIENSIQGKVIYPSVDWIKTFRGIVHEFTQDSPWNQLVLTCAWEPKPISRWISGSRCFLLFICAILRRGHIYKKPMENGVHWSCGRIKSWMWNRPWLLLIGLLRWGLPSCS